MIASTQITSTEIFAFTAVLAFKILSKVLFKKIANFMGKLPQNYK